MQPDISFRGEKYKTVIHLLSETDFNCVLHKRVGVIGVGTGGTTGAMAPSLFSQNYSQNLSFLP